jgi:hypothetical protein
MGCRVGESLSQERHAPDSINVTPWSDAVANARPAVWGGLCEQIPSYFSGDAPKTPLKFRQREARSRLERDQREPPYGAMADIRNAVNVNGVPRRDAEPGFFGI